MATIRVAGVGEPLPHVQKFADDVEEYTRGQANSFGTYPGHEPSLERAIDAFVPVFSDEPGNSVCDFALNNWKKYGLRYIIFRQRINYNDGRGWIFMEDRGSPTQNHFDHVHLAFEETAELDLEDEEQMQPATENAIQHFDTLVDKLCRSIGKAYDGVEDGYHGAEVVGRWLGKMFKSAPGG